jgi:hypothetical protein
MPGEPVTPLAGEDPGSKRPGGRADPPGRLSTTKGLTALATNPAVLILADTATARELLGAWPSSGAAVQHPRAAKADRSQPPGGLAARQDRVCTHLRAALDYWRRQGDVPSPGELREALKINSQTACDLARMLRAMPGAYREPETTASG